MRVCEIITEGWFGFGEGDPIPAPEWLNASNRALWQQKNPTTDDDRFVAQLKNLETQAGAGLEDMANQTIEWELNQLEDAVEEQDVGGMATQTLTPEDELGWGFRFNDPEAYVRRMIASVPGGDGFIRPVFHRGGLIGVSTRTPQDTRALQQFLQRQGYSVGSMDGAWGPRTQAALEQYLRDYRQQNASMADRLRGSQQ